LLANDESPLRAAIDALGHAFEDFPERAQGQQHLGPQELAVVLQVVPERLPVLQAALDAAHLATPITML
jgi:hypothetical protein